MAEDRTCGYDRTLRAVLVAAAALASATTVADGAARAAGGAEETVHEGPAVAVGNGSARVVVTTTAAGAPRSVSVVLTAAALEGLPGGDTAYVLALPESAPAAGYDHVLLDWTPGGHPPAGVYTVPHFDVHFYMITAAERERITFAGPGGADAARVTDAALVPEGHVLPPDAAVERMGAHAFDPAGPEFRGQPFTHTFVHGYYRGRPTFFEPMVTLAHLAGGEDVTMPVAAPAEVASPGFYPTAYRIGRDAGRGLHFVSLTGLAKRAPAGARPDASE